MHYRQDLRSGLLLPAWPKRQRGFFAMGPAFFKQPSAGGGATPTFVSRVHCTPAADGSFVSPPFVSGAFDAVATNLIVVAIAQYRYTDRPITTVTDTAGNTYTKAAYVAQSAYDADLGIACWYCLSSAAKTGNVVTLNNGGNSLNQFGASVLQWSGGTWTYAAGNGYVTGAFVATATAAAINMTGKGVVVEMGLGNNENVASGWNFSAGCSNFYGSASTPDGTTEDSGIIGADVLAAASSSHTFTATFVNTHPLLGQWGFLLS